MPQPMGFRTSRATTADAAMLIIGREVFGSEATIKKASDGADAMLFHAKKSGLKAEDVQKTTKTAGGIPWGVYLEESGNDIEALIKAGCDFVVFAPTSQITDLPQDEKTGKILEVESSMDDGLLRAVNDLPADAVLITDTLDKAETLTIHRLMMYQHLANFIVKPLIIPVPVNITEAELKALHEAGIDGVMAEGDLKELRLNISKLPPRTAKKRDKTGVLLPRAGGETNIEPDEEEDE